MSFELDLCAYEIAEDIAKATDTLCAKFMVENPHIPASRIEICYMTDLATGTRIWVQERKDA